MRLYRVSIRNLMVGKGHPTRLMGIINLSPESFYSTSVTSPAQIVDRALKMERDGAEILDIGGVSTAPPDIYGTSPISEEEEFKRVTTAMDQLREVIDIPISIDTMSARVAEAALDRGADVINDVSGMKHDSRMARVLAKWDVPVVIMASCSGPRTTVGDTIDALQDSLRIAHQAGISQEKIIIDPGIGFGRPPEEDVRVLRDLRRFALFGHPVLVGVSRKSFIGRLLGGRPPGQRLTGTVAATAIAVVNGADIIRAHDIGEAVDTIRIAMAIRGREVSTEKILLFEGMREFEVEVLLEHIGTSETIRKSLARKGVMLNVYLREVVPAAALVLKQEMLALGGDAAYHHDTIDCSIPLTDVLLMGTPTQVLRLSEKIRVMKYFGLSDLGENLQKLLEERAAGQGV
ncbi:MAG: dihydropteroate synthase [Candidatus Thorarchaeota archaeon]